MTRFDGADYVPQRDDVRLTNQLLRVFNAMADGRWHTLNELHTLTNDPVASISAQLRHLRKERFGGHTVNRRHVGGGLFEYQLEVTCQTPKSSGKARAHTATPQTPIPNTTTATLTASPAASQINRQRNPVGRALDIHEPAE